MDTEINLRDKTLDELTVEDAAVVAVIVCASIFALKVAGAMVKPKMIQFTKRLQAKTEELKKQNQK